MMAIRDQLEKVAAWFGFGVDEEEYYDEYEDEGYSRSGRKKSREAEELEEGRPYVRRLGREERSPAFRGSLGNIFGDEENERERHSEGGSSRQHLRPVPDQQAVQAKVSVVSPSTFNDAQELADRYKRQQPVILNLQNVDSDLSRRMVDFCSGLTYALDGQIQTVANRVFLLTPQNVEVSAEERKRLAERAFFNQI